MIWPVIVFFLVHAWISVFFQSFFLHRYATHRQFAMSKAAERICYLLTWFAQGPSFLVPKGYAGLHAEHHAFSDTPRDPHSPHHSKGLTQMMLRTRRKYIDLVDGLREPEVRIPADTPSWPLVDRIAQGWTARLSIGGLYGLFYFAVGAPLWLYALLPVQWLIGPVHGAIVNWCGHRYGYRNFEETGDKSRNALPIDFVTLGELYQNNHHADQMDPNFARRWWELDVTYQVMRVLDFFGWISLPERKLPERKAQAARSLPAAGEALPVVAVRRVLTPYVPAFGQRSKGY